MLVARTGQGGAQLGRGITGSSPRSRATQERRDTADPESGGKPVRRAADPRRWRHACLLAKLQPGAEVQATWEEFDLIALVNKLGLLMMYGQMTAGSWIYIGTQGILQGTYETFASAADKHFGGTLAGTITLTAGLGGMGGAQPAARRKSALAGGVSICIEIDASRIQRRLDTFRYLDEVATSLSTTPSRARNAPRATLRALSIGLARQRRREVLPQIVARNFTPHLVTDQTSAHDPMWGYIPPHKPDEDIDELRAKLPDEYPQAHSRLPAMSPRMSRPSLELHSGRGAIALRLRQPNLRAQARARRTQDGVRLPGIRAGLHSRTRFAKDADPSDGWLSPEIPRTSPATDKGTSRPLPRRRTAAALAGSVGRATGLLFQGLPARICWLGYGQRDKAGLLFNAMVRDGRLKAPIVIGRDHLDAGSVASPYRETEAMKGWFGCRE